MSGRRGVGDAVRAVPLVMAVAQTASADEMQGLPVGYVLRMPRVWAAPVGGQVGVREVDRRQAER